MRSVPISGAALFANARKVSVDKFQIKNEAIIVTPADASHDILYIFSQKAFGGNNFLHVSYLR